VEVGRVSIPHSPCNSLHQCIVTAVSPGLEIVAMHPDDVRKVSAAQILAMSRGRLARETAQFHPGFFRQGCTLHKRLIHSALGRRFASANLPIKFCGESPTMSGLDVSIDQVSIVRAHL
jgi:hypothetical protein